MPASAWGDLDRAPEPQRYVAGLDRLRADPFFVEQKAKLAADLELAGDERIVDVGCGTGEDAAELARAGCDVVGVERSTVMIGEARHRHPSLPFVAADAGRLPFASAAFDRVRVDRVLHHLPQGAESIRQWRRVLRTGGLVAIFAPDHTTARVEGVDARAATAVAAWLASTRPGADCVRALADVLGSAGFADVRVELVPLELGDLGRADGIMGLVDWGEAATAAGVLDPDAGARWRDDTQTAARGGTLRYACTYVRAVARAV